jgi:ABC-type multidrug transport system fused ATPase/permease subunit
MIDKILVGARLNICSIRFRGCRLYCRRFPAGAVSLEVVTLADTDPTGRHFNWSWRAWAGGLHPSLWVGHPQSSARSVEPSASVVQLCKWAWDLLSGTRWRVAAAAAVSLFVVQVLQFNAALLVHAVALLQGPATASANSIQNFWGLMPASLYATAILFGVISLALFGLQYFDRYFTLAIDTVVIYHLQEKLHRKMLRLGIRYHNNNNIGSLQMLFTRYVSQSAGILREIVSFPVVNGIALITAVIYLWQNLSPIIGPQSIAVLPLILAALVALPIAAWRVSQMMREAIRSSIAADNAVNEELVNTLRRPIDIQLLGAQELRNQAFAARVRIAIAARLRSLRRSELANEIQRGMPQILQAGILIFAVAEVLGMPEGGQRFVVGSAVVGILMFVPMILAPIQQTMSFYNAAIASIPPVVQLVDALRAEEEVVEAADAVPIALTKGTISARDVHIAGSDPNNPILRGITHEFEGGKVWGLIGRSGCGKSTLLTALARAVDPSLGTVLIDGTDVRRFQLVSLRKAVSFMGQFPVFIDDTVRSNLNLATSPSPDPDLLEACQATGLADRLREIAAPTSPLDLVIYAEPNKGALSGGERRLLAIARVLAHPAGIILLDEPCAGVDGAMRERIANLIKARPAGATVIVVDHDLEFIASVADAVVCMEQGTIACSIPRAELLQKPSLFLELWTAEHRFDGASMNTENSPVVAS